MGDANDVRNESETNDVPQRNMPLISVPVARLRTVATPDNKPCSLVTPASLNAQREIVKGRLFRQRRENAIFHKCTLNTAR